MNTIRPIPFVTCALLLGAATQTAGAATACAELTTFSLPGYAVKITSTRSVPAGPMAAPPNAPPAPARLLPAHCLVDGTIDERTGRNGKPYAIGFSVAMPASWNGRFYFQGGGGLNGAVNPPVGAQYAGDSTALAKGFAVVSTDSGHKGTGFDATFFEDQEASLNFLYQGVAKTTVVAKEIVTQHYGTAPHHSYFVGCSTGGREAMMMSQRFPTYFDGIVAGAPATRTGYSNLALRWATTALNQVAPKDAEGKPQTRLALSDQDRKLVTDGLLAACDATDGAKDGLVSSPQRCNFDPKVLTCQGAKTASCLSAAQVTAVQKVMAGPKASNGRQVYPGFYFDTGITNTRGLPGLLVGPVIPEGATNGMSMDVDAEAARAHDGRSMAGDSNAWTNLSSFRGRGGKLIFFHGVSDPWFSAQETVQYYERLATDNAEVPVRDWSRLFLVPGMGHCSGGDRTLDRFDIVEPLVSWVEKGSAPEQVVATGASMPNESRPLCPFPAGAQYNGSGDAKSAANYSCRN
jgi:pimeloyl-ACP methyl ester carboxylesterase